jgi:hypothetical protein
MIGKEGPKQEQKNRQCGNSIAGNVGCKEKCHIAEWTAGNEEKNGETQQVVAVVRLRAVCNRRCSSVELSIHGFGRGSN